MRITSVDTLRLFAIIAVIAIHTEPFKQNNTEFNAIYFYLHIGINQLARFGVPFFFVISGYFYGIKLLHGSCPVKVAKAMLSRILILYISWCLIYLLPYNSSVVADYGALGLLKGIYWRLTNIIGEPMVFLFQGSVVHLWFLVSLIICIAITAIFVKNNLFKLLITLSVLLYCFGILAKAYSATEIGFNIEFNTRDGPFFGLIFFVTGYFLAKEKAVTNWLYYGFAVFTVGGFLHFSESFLLMHKYNASLVNEFVFGTYFMGVGAALMSLSNHKFLSSKISAGLGKMTLGVYVSHFIFINLLRPIDQLTNHPVWEICFVVLVLIFSLLLTKLLSMSKLTKKIVE